MNKLFSIFTFIVILLSVVTPVRAADTYANSVVTSSSAGLFSPEKSLGAPDGQFADLMEADLSLTLDMGAGEEGIDDLLVTYSLLQVGALAQVTFMAENNDVLATTSTYLDSNATVWTAVYDGETEYRYVVIENLEDAGWQLDSVEALAIAVIDEPVEEPIEEPVEEPEAESEPATIAGDLIKTDISASVYLVGADGKRHAFPNETTFFSWDYSFDDVEAVDADTMASYTLGGNVTVKPGSYLVKIQSDAKVYAVAPEAELRWIMDEPTAMAIYGAEWASEVIDIDVTFWNNYTLGENVDEQSDTEGWDIAGDRY